VLQDVGQHDAVERTARVAVAVRHGLHIVFDQGVDSGPGQRRQVGVVLDPGDVVAAPAKRLRHQPGAAADVEHPLGERRYQHGDLVTRIVIGPMHRAPLKRRAHPPRPHAAVVGGRRHRAGE